MAKRAKKGGGRKGGGGQPRSAGVAVSVLGALVCSGAVFAEGALFGTPAADFLRATNSVPFAAWDARVALGFGILLLIGVHMLSSSVLAGVFIDRLKSAASGNA